MLLALILPFALSLVSAHAAVPPAGTVIANTASSSQQVGAAPQVSTTNAVLATVAAAPGSPPVLTKSFGSPAIAFGGSSPLTFHLANAAGNPAQAGIAFTDTLPSGLVLTAGATAAVSGPGCTAVVTLTPPSTISVAGMTMASGSASCDITVNGVTNAAAVNPSCAANPPAFTNGASAISGTVNVVNGVTNQCLVVNPVLTVTATPICVRDTPFVDYNATVLGVGAPFGVTITWQKTTGEVVRVLSGQPLTGRLLWPGAEVDSAGNPIAWPGWVFFEGEWFQINDGLRPDMLVTFQVNPTAQVTVSYPPATPACNAGPRNVTNSPDMGVMKSLSAYQGPSPSGPYTVTLRYGNAGADSAAKHDVTISDQLPAGMQFVPGSLRLIAIGSDNIVKLPAASGNFTFGNTAGSYQVAANLVSVNFPTLAQNETGLIAFDVNIDSNLAVDSLVKNTAQYRYTRSTGYTVSPRNSNTVTFRVAGSEGVTLRGMTLPSVDPGSTAIFENLLTNNSGHADTFNITLSGSNFPAGTVFKLYRADGVTLLADSNGDGVADTGVVAAGGTFKIIVKAQIPNGAAGGPYSVAKNAQSIGNPLVHASDNDIVSTVASLCRVVFEPANAGRVAAGGSITYSHVLTNVGNCTEKITFPAELLANSAAGWTTQLFLDNPAAGGQSIVGVLDAGDAPVDAGTTFSLAPGERMVVLVRVTAPATAANGAGDTTTIRAIASATGAMTVSDLTTVSASPTGIVSDEITGFVDPLFQRPTVWGFIGKPLYLRANAPSCNADPTVIEHRTIIITGPNGEREEIIATETGPNTGMFVADAIGIRLPPVIAADNILEGRPYDSLQVELVGCGKKIATAITLIDPNGVVFDSRNNQPIAGATVRLVNAAAGQCTSAPATVGTLNGGTVVPAPSSVTTGPDGRFAYPLVAPGDYCALVSPPNGYTWASAVPFNQLPAGRNVLATGPTSGGSYGGVFHVGPETGPVIIDIPVDGGLLGGLFVQKSSMRAVVEIGDVLDYAVTVRNATGYVLSQSDVLLTDTLPAGFTYVAGSARLDGKRLADPQGGSGPRLLFNLGRMARDQQLGIAYRVRVGPGALQGDGINRVVASYRAGGNTVYSESNVATAKVEIAGGAFTDRGYIIGKVFADCDGDGVQSAGGKDNAHEVGVPGVRLYLEDGTSVITDAEGKYSLYGLLARTHVIKLDRTTLPAGVTLKDLAILSNRNLGKGDSRVVDLKNGELHKANFAINSCSEAVVSEITKRRQAAASLKSEVDGRLQQRFETDPNLRQASDIKALPAAGTVGTAAPTANIAAPAALGSSVQPAITTNAVNSDGLVAAPVARVEQSAAVAAPDAARSRAAIESAAREPDIVLENILPAEDNTLGFIGLKDGDLLPYAQITVRVKGTAGSSFRLIVNGSEIGEDRIGKKAVFTDRQSQAWEYIGVNLKVGENTLTVRQLDQFGNARGEKSIKATAPGALAKVVVELPPSARGGATADGRTPARVTVRLTDDHDVPVTSRTAVTLTSSLGRWKVEDLNPVEPGVQTFIQGGRAEFDLLPPAEPGEAQIRVASGDIKSEVRLDFLPDLREMIAAGVIEGVLNLRKLDSRALTPARAQDGFEQEITHLARNWGDGKQSAAARASLFLKGAVKGEYLLTMAYDSDKNTRDRLFRDIQPDEFYPIYGDSSVRAFDAQSTGRFYVRVDNRKSYLLFGDFNTAQSSEARKLSNYSRSLTGAKEHFESGRVSANVFASRDSTRQVIDEFRANGTSGPFTLSRASGLINSEKIEILTRDRNQPAVILHSQPLARFADYEIEPLTGRILFKAPIASLDENLNPLSIRVIYEVDQGGKNFWVAGIDAQVKLTEQIEVGAMFVDDKNPLDKFRMAGVNAIARLADKTFLIAELARTQRESFVNALSQGSKEGNAERIEFRHSGNNLEASLYAGRADAGFDNQGSSLTQGRQEIGGKLAYKLDDKTRIRGELLRTEDIVAGTKRDGLLLVAERTLENGLRLEAGLRHASESQPSPAAGTTAAPNQVTAVRARVTGEIPNVKDASAYAEAEIDVQDSARKIAAVGADYKLGASGRLYARHEFISSLTGPYGLNNQQRQNATVVGVNTDYMKDGNLFSEYRVRDAIDGGAAEAALGLRNTWTLADGLRLQTGFERVHALSGAGDTESTAATFGVEYTASPLWKGSTRLELRNSRNSDSILSTIAGASKLSRNWTFLGRNTYSLLKNKGQSTGEQEQDRAQLGLAFRDTDTDVWNALGRVEHRTEKDTTQEGIALKRTVEMISVHANWQPRRPFVFSARYAAKWSNENSNGVHTRNNAQLVAGRAVWEFAPRWDLALNASTMLGRGVQSKYYGLGVELGFMVMENLWVSAGYNVFGYREDDLAAGEYTNKGAFVRLRYKFDEDLFAARSGSTPAASNNASASAR